MTRSRVTDVFGLVHYVDGTKAYLDTGLIRVTTLCGAALETSSEKTSKPVAPTCFGCMALDARSLRLYANLDRRGRHARRSARR